MSERMFYRFNRFFVRLKLGRWTVDAPPPDGPTVYVCSHENMLGPLVTQAYMPRRPRPWVLHVFCDREACRKQFGEYTFSERFGLPGPLARFLARAVSRYVSALVRCVGSIPVYRGTIRITATFRATVEALRAGDSVVVFPSVAYTDEAGAGDLYRGFLLIDRFWRRVSDEPVRFVPLRLDREARRLAAGTPVRFERADNGTDETARVLEDIRRQLDGG